MMDEMVIDLGYVEEGREGVDDWIVKEAPAIGEVGMKMYSISFVSKEGMMRALEGNPWSIMGHCLNLKKWPANTPVAQLDFKGIQFWIQIHNLPRELMTKQNGENIGKSLGEIIEVSGFQAKMVKKDERISNMKSSLISVLIVGGLAMVVSIANLRMIVLEVKKRHGGISGDDAWNTIGEERVDQFLPVSVTQTQQARGQGGSRVECDPRKSSAEMRGKAADNSHPESSENANVVIQPKQKSSE
ncbi:hypothetical protein COLO4_28598 [Corchorus olitorius]|uniref:Uncharacterized protein n=1 Tax=Corchorus olitorius TaxID=93759 RepID=A0A1R3HJB0_9ROSI|nr:hypothetical protein COLO4_28598 [Corchorus olitorius]